MQKRTIEMHRRSIIPLETREIFLRENKGEHPRWRGYNHRFAEGEGAAGTFCNCQRANLSDERLVARGLATSHHTRHNHFIHNSLAFSARGGRVAGAWCGESNGRNLYPTPAFRASLCTDHCEFTHVRPIHTRAPPFDSSGVTTFDTFAEISSGRRRWAGVRMEFDGFPFLEARWRSTIIINRFRVETCRDRGKSVVQVFNFDSNSIRWNRVERGIVLILNRKFMIWEKRKRKRDNRWINFESLCWKCKSVRTWLLKKGLQ